MRRFLKKMLRSIAVLAALCAVLLILFRIKYQNAMLELAQTQLRNSTSDLINDAIDRQIELGNIQYDRMVYLEKDLNGRITALKTNMSEVNRLKTDILALINDEILALDTSDLGIPIGSLVLPEIFSGRGLQIPVMIHSIRNSDASFSSTFTQAGINQTLQQLNMEVLVDVTILVLGETSSFTVSTHVVVAETVIVGEVPDTYLQSGGIL